MAPKTVLIAPVAAEFIASALTRPRLLDEVAFGTRQRALDAPPGTTVFLYATADYSRFHPFLRDNFVTWMGTLGRIVPAVAQGPRRGMHPDQNVRPPFAETYDYKDAALFWHLQGLSPLAQPVPLDRFREQDGAKLFGGLAPMWIARAVMQDEPAEQVLQAA